MEIFTRGWLPDWRLVQGSLSAGKHSASPSFQATIVYAKRVHLGPVCGWAVCGSLAESIFPFEESALEPGPPEVRPHTAIAGSAVSSRSRCNLRRTSAQYFVCLNDTLERVSARAVEPKSDLCLLVGVFFPFHDAAFGYYRANGPYYYKAGGHPLTNPLPTLRTPAQTSQQCPLRLNHLP